MDSFISFCGNNLIRRFLGVSLKYILASSPASFGYSFDNCSGTSGNSTNDLTIRFTTFDTLVNFANSVVDYSSNSVVDYSSNSVVNYSSFFAFDDGFFKSFGGLVTYNLDSCGFVTYNLANFVNNVADYSSFFACFSISSGSSTSTSECFIDSLSSAAPSCMASMASFNVKGPKGPGPGLFD